jgi:hypothetical protein
LECGGEEEDAPEREEEGLFLSEEDATESLWVCLRLWEDNERTDVVLIARPRAVREAVVDRIAVAVTRD